MKFIVMAILTLTSISSWAACKAGKDQAAYAVKGMHCKDCVDSIQGYFSKQETVAKADVSLPNKCLKLTFKPGASMSKTDVEAGLKSLGYDLAEGTKAN